MILVSTLLCDRKKSSQLVAIRRMAELDYPDYGVYINVETKNYNENFSELKEFLSTVKVPVYMDIWSCYSNWWIPPAFDQDQARLHPIMIGRNMTIQAAQLLKASHLLQVDADVIVPVDSIQRLLAIDRPLAGGMVPGRGAHGSAWYGKQPPPETRTPGLRPNLVEMEYCTCGFLMIRKEVFDRLKYRMGPHNKVEAAYLSEDPAFGTDAHDVWGFPWWTVDTTLRAEHWDDPSNPLHASAGAQF